MERVFTEDLGRWQAGDVRDFPIQTWKGISASAKRPLEEFSKPWDPKVVARDLVKDKRKK